MNESVNWEEVKYLRHFEQELLGLEQRRKHDPLCKVEDIEAVLENLYIVEGSDWEGRANAVSLYRSAAIAAHEHFIAAWKAERKDN